MKKAFFASFFCLLFIGSSVFAGQDGLGGYHFQQNPSPEIPLVISGYHFLIPGELYAGHEAGEMNEGNGEVETTWYRDMDLDGFGRNSMTLVAASQPAGYVSVGGDCNDMDANSYPGAAETGDGKDNDCDGQIDEGLPCLTTWYRDMDNDGYGKTLTTKLSCVKPAGFTAIPGDCYDMDNTIYPGATELPDGKDNDCDGLVDDGLACGTTVWYRDMDGDGFGKTMTKMACVKPAGYAAVSGDCNDMDATVYPGGPELVDGKDNNCNGQIDEGTGCIPKSWYRDMDGDGVGRVNLTVNSCTKPYGYAATSGDCNDMDATIYPGAPELGDGKDNNCDGQTDEGLPCQVTWYKDIDGDGIGKTTYTKLSCVQPAGYVATGGDCNEMEATVYPGAPELGDGMDNDCDGLVDEELTCRVTWYRDMDGDGFGRSTMTKLSCVQPSGYVALGTDCNDMSNLIYPGAAEVCDGKDNDCDGVVDESCGPVTSPMATGSDMGVSANRMEEVAVAGGARLQVWPNPARNAIVVVLNGFEPGEKVELQMVGSDGRKAFSQSLVQVSSNQQVTMDIRNLVSGIYQVLASQGSRQQATRVLVNR